MGAVQFSDEEILEWNLDQYYDRASMIDAIERIRYFGGFTNLAGGLEMTRQRIFDIDRGDRPGVPNIALVITDGVPNRREGETLPQADLLKDIATVVSVTVGITDAMAIRLLEDVATRPSDVIQVADFDGLTADLDRIVNQVCPVPTSPPSGLQIIMFIMTT